MRKAIFFLALLAPLLFASHLWQFATEGPISVKPKIVQGMVIFASDDGNVYSLDPSSGARKWKTFVGKEPNEILLFDNSIVTSTTSGHVVRLDLNGKVAWDLNLNTTKHNATFVYGASANQRWIAVTADNGVYLIDKNGSVRSKIMSYADAVSTPPAAGDDFVVFGKGSELIKLKENGQIEWKSPLDEGSFWTSAPIIDADSVYIGALDNKLHSYSLNGGFRNWEYRTHNWIVGTPLVDGGSIYFGSNDGRVYALDKSSGTSVWSVQMQLGFNTQPEIGYIGGQPAIFIGGTDTSIYALNSDTGEVLWKGVTAGAIGSPLFFTDRVIFGSADGSAYAYSTERACAITTPVEADIIGLKELVVSGRHVSEAGGSTVWVSINDGSWEESNTTGAEWIYYANPQEKLVSGLNTISCKVVDSAGEESGERFTTITINHDPSLPLSGMVVTMSPSVIEGKEFTVYVNDGDDGSPLERFVLSVAGKNYSADRSVNVTIGQAGAYRAVIRKIGFVDYSTDINVSSSGVNPIYAVAGAALIIVIIWQIWTRFISQRFAKPKQ